MDVESGTADQAVVDLGAREDIKYITVRTKSSKDTVSSESDRVMVPPHIVGRVDSDTESEGEIIERLRKDRVELINIHPQLEHANIMNSGGIAATSNPPSFEELQQPREVLINYTSGYPELDSDIGPSELSDIAEEPEEGLTDSDSDQSTPRPSLQSQQRNLHQQRKLSMQNGMAQLQTIPITSNSSRKSQDSIKVGDVSNDTKATPPVSNGSLSDTIQSEVVAGKASLNRWNKTGSSPNLVISASQFQAQPLFSPVPETSNALKVTSSTSTLISDSETISKKEHSVSNAKTFSSVSTQPKTNSTSTVRITHDAISSETTEGENEKSNAERISEVKASSVTNVNHQNSSNNKNALATPGTKQVQVTATTASPTDKRVIKIFVALFDYDPPTMSPNPDACDEELPFREGQLIKVYGEKDADGFYWGEAGNRSGYVPCNMVSEVQVEDDRVAEELFREQSTKNPAMPSSSLSNRSTVMGTKSTAFESDDRWGDIYEDMPAKRKLALYDYDPNELSPNVDAEVELSFRTGDMLLVYGDMDDDGFYMGELNGRRGLVPSNFLTDVPPGYVVVEPASPANRFTTTTHGINSVGIPKANNLDREIVSTNTATPLASATSIKSTNYISTSGAAVASIQHHGINYSGRNQHPEVRPQQPRVLGQQRRW